MNWDMEREMWWRWKMKKAIRCWSVQLKMCFYSDLHKLYHHFCMYCIYLKDKAKCISSISIFVLLIIKSNTLNTTINFTFPVRCSFYLIMCGGVCDCAVSSIPTVFQLHTYSWHTKKTYYLKTICLFAVFPLLLITNLHYMCKSALWG